MSVSTPSQGTHFSDGVRVGPILGSSYAAGVNVSTPSVMVSSPGDQLPPGVYTTPTSLLDFIPAPVSANALATAQTLAAAGYVTLVTTNTINSTVITYQSIPNVLKLDSARSITITGAAGGVTVAQFRVFGWDQYGVPMTEEITGPLGAATVYGNKAFKYIRAVYSLAGTGANITVGVGNAFGFPYYIASEGYTGVLIWNGQPRTLIVTAHLAANPITTTNGSSVVTVALTANDADIAATGLVVGQWIQMGGITGFNGIPSNKFNDLIQITSLNYLTNTFSYDTRVLATSSGAGGGGALVCSAQTNDKTVTGDQRVATASTWDVRGTITPPSDANGNARLTLEMYNASADTRNYNSASTGNTYLNTDPLSVTTGTSTIVVFAPNHQLTGGENVTIAGATAFAGIAAASLNITAPITILDQDTFTYVATAPATSSNSGGGTGVNLTPGLGNLYQSSVGRFGVTQYNLTPLPA